MGGFSFYGVQQFIVAVLSFVKCNNSFMVSLPRTIRFWGLSNHCCDLGVQQFIVAIYRIKTISSVESVDRNSPPICDGNFRKRGLNSTREEEPETKPIGSIYKETAFGIVALRLAVVEKSLLSRD
jgi:hypothetical protein